MRFLGLSTLLTLGILLFFVANVYVERMQNGEQNESGFIAGIGGGPETVGSIDQIVINPQEYIGSLVTVEGRIKRITTANSFFIGQNGGNNELLVITAVPLNQRQDNPSAPFKVGEAVVVTGTVRSMNITEIELQMGTDLDPDVENEVSNKLVIVATSVRSLLQL